jgi:hypothetical protein
MRYTVVWLRSTEVELARIWCNVADRQSVTLAANEIDHLLRTSAEARGNDLEGTKDFTIFPLRVRFDVSPDDRRVTVFEVVHLMEP